MLTTAGPRSTDRSRRPLVALARATLAGAGRSGRGRKACRPDLHPALVDPGGDPARSRVSGAPGDPWPCRRSRSSARGSSRGPCARTIPHHDAYAFAIGVGALLFLRRAARALRVSAAEPARSRPSTSPPPVWLSATASRRLRRRSGACSCACIPSSTHGLAAWPSRWPNCALAFTTLTEAPALARAPARRPRSAALAGSSPSPAGRGAGRPRPASARCARSRSNAPCSPAPLCAAARPRVPRRRRTRRAPPRRCAPPLPDGPRLGDARRLPDHRRRHARRSPATPRTAPRADRAGATGRRASSTPTRRCRTPASRSPRCSPASTSTRSRRSASTPRSHETLAEVLRRERYKTAAFYPAVGVLHRSRTLDGRYEAVAYGFEYVKYEYLAAPERTDQVIRLPRRASSRARAFVVGALLRAARALRARTPGVHVARGDADVDRYDGEVALRRRARSARLID